MIIAVFKMKEEYNDYLEIEEIQNNYFNKELKYKLNGKYFTTNHKYNVAFNCDKVLFKYKNMYIAEANKCLSYNRISLEDFNPNYEKLTYYYLFDPSSIKKIPPIKAEIIEQYFEPIKQSQNAVLKRIVKKDKEKEFQKIINLGNQESLFQSKYWKNTAKELELDNILKEINLYNFENIHTAFFSNFIKNDNIYGLGNKPFLEFLTLLKEKDPNLPNIDVKDFKIYYQKRYKDNNKYIIPDITIDINTISNEKYRLIIEAKVTAEENLYTENNTLIKQCHYYQKFFNENKDNNDYQYIYIFLSMKKQNINNYINITFKEIANKLYRFQTKIKNEKILRSYLKSFHNLCDSNKYPFSIDDIPLIYWYDDEKLMTLYNLIKKDIKSIAEYEKASKLKESSLVNNYKYILVLLYNMKNLSEEEKETIKKCYDLLV